MQGRVHRWSFDLKENCSQYQNLVRIIDSFAKRYSDTEYGLVAMLQEELDWQLKKRNYALALFTLNLLKKHYHPDGDSICLQQYLPKFGASIEAYEIYYQIVVIQYKQPVDLLESQLAGKLVWIPS